MNNNPVLTEQERTLILDLTSGRKTLPDFCREFGRNVCDENDFILKSLQQIENRKDGASLPYILYLWGYVTESTTPAHMAVLRRLLLETWHDQQEWIVDTIREAQDVESLPAISRAARTTYPRFDELDQESFHKRCVYAIEAVDSPATAEFLRELSEENSEIGKLADGLLKARK